jgi:4-(2-carboxyphenyl)-2-oxobut-3-enoate aldolase
MLTAKDVGGMMAMMPAFATDEAADIRARNTVSIPRLHQGLDRMVRDGANVISTTGSFGECHALLPDEFAVIANESSAVMKQRVPLFVGVTAPNARETYERMKVVAQTKADGVLIGIPYYFPSTQANALRFIQDMAKEFPKLNMLLYHNPTLHNVTLNVELFPEFVKIPQIVGMKDSHREPMTLIKLDKIVRGKISILVNQLQIIPYKSLGAAGFWSIDSWMGPWPFFALRDAVARGDEEAAKTIMLDIAPPGTVKADLSWRETASKIAIRYAGYVDPGPLRPPFLEIPPEVDANMKRKAERWKALCEKYRPAYEAKKVAAE